jgi:hypothetical protein
MARFPTAWVAAQTYAATTRIATWNFGLLLCPQSKSWETTKEIQSEKVNPVRRRRVFGSGLCGTCKRAVP